jgi:hypothetical protein
MVRAIDAASVALLPDSPPLLAPSTVTGPARFARACLMSASDSEGAFLVVAVGGDV